MTKRDIADILEAVSQGAGDEVHWDECRAAAAEIRSLRAAVPHWISVAERLPDRDWDGFSDIVVVAAGGSYFLGRYYKCEPGDECHECEADIGEQWYIETTMPVTHWMPLPPPPTEKP
jgi:hypothetical protein